MNENLIAAIDSDHICIFVAIHVSKRLQMAEIRHLAHPDIHLVQAFGRRKFKELSAKDGHVEELLAVWARRIVHAVASVEVLLLALMLCQLLLVFDLVELSLSFCAGGLQRCCHVFGQRCLALGSCLS